MSDNSAIEWTDATWNPLLGCTKVSPGCDSCYAITNARIRESNPNPKVAIPYAGLVHRDEAGVLDWTGNVNLVPDRLSQPFRWKRPRRIFVNSQSDLFHDQVPDEYIAQVFAVMALADQHTFQLLTKRHARMRSLLSSAEFQKAVAVAAIVMAEAEAGPPYLPEHLVMPPAGTSWWPLSNVWLGVSVEDQKWADIRIPALMETPAAVRFLSCEPLLGPIKLSHLHSHCPTHDFAGGFCMGYCSDRRIPDWVIAGGESGHGARPVHPDWFRALRDQCISLRIPFLLKQWGEWSPPATEPSDGEAARLKAICVQPDGQITPWDQEPYGTAAATMVRPGKKVAGRELDGRTWDQYPAAVA